MKCLVDTICFPCYNALDRNNFQFSLLSFSTPVLFSLLLHTLIIITVSFRRLSPVSLHIWHIHTFPLLIRHWIFIIVFIYYYYCFSAVRIDTYIFFFQRTTRTHHSVYLLDFILHTLRDIQCKRITIEIQNETKKKRVIWIERSNEQWRQKINKT